jgi:hypothetical protein
MPPTCLLVLLCRVKVELNMFVVVILKRILRLMFVIHVIFDCLIKCISILVFKDCVCVRARSTILLLFCGLLLSTGRWGFRGPFVTVCIYITTCTSFSCGVTATQSRYILLELDLSSSFCSLLLWATL